MARHKKYKQHNKQATGNQNETKSLEKENTKEMVSEKTEGEQNAVLDAPRTDTSTDIPTSESETAVIQEPQTPQNNQPVYDDGDDELGRAYDEAMAELQAEKEQHYANIHKDDIAEESEEGKDGEQADGQQSDEPVYTENAETSNDNMATEEEEDTENNIENAEESEPAEEEIQEDQEDQDGYGEVSAEPLYDVTTSYNYALLKKYERAKPDNQFNLMKHKSDMVLLVLALFMLIMRAYGGAIGIALLVPFKMLCEFGMRKLRLKRYFKENKRTWNCPTRIALYEDYILRENDFRKRELGYDDIKGYLEDNDYLFLLTRNSKDIIVIEKEKTSEDLIFAVEQLLTEPENE